MKDLRGRRGGRCMRRSVPRKEMWQGLCVADEVAVGHPFILRLRVERSGFRCASCVRPLSVSPVHRRVPVLPLQVARRVESTVCKRAVPKLLGAEPRVNCDGRV